MVCSAGDGGGGRRSRAAIDPGDDPALGRRCEAEIREESWCLQGFSFGRFRLEIILNRPSCGDEIGDHYFFSWNLGSTLLTSKSNTIFSVIKPLENTIVLHQLKLNQVSLQTRSAGFF